MHYKHIIPMVVAVLVLVGCKKDKVTIDEEYYRPLYEVSQAFGQLETGMAAYSEQGNDNEHAFTLAAEDLVNSALVSAVEVFDSAYAYITMQNGLKVVYALIPVNDQGEPLVRGGGTGSGGTLKVLSGACANEIENKKILLFEAQFQTTSSAYSVLTDNAEEYELEVTRVAGKQANYDVVQTFPEYGLVVINTHGLPNGFLMGEALPLPKIIDNQPTLDAFATFVNVSDPDQVLTDRLITDLHLNIVHNKHFNPTVPIYQTLNSDDADGLSYQIDGWLPSEHIAQMDLSNTIVFGNMCYSGWSNTTALNISDIPILNAFEQANVRTYYGYQQEIGRSIQVNDPFAKDMEERLYRSFFEDGDNTGEAHLDNSGTETADPFWPSSLRPIRLYGPLYFRQFFAEDYCYEDACLDSIQDPRDLQWYRTTCIGDQVWMAENMNYTPGICYDDAPDNCDQYGRMYTIMEATGAQASSPGSPVKGICPEGWHVPSQQEFEELIDFLGGSAVAGDSLKATGSWPGTHSDPYGFSALAAGWWQSTPCPTPPGLPGYCYLGLQTSFWTSTVNGGGTSGDFIYSTVQLDASSATSIRGIRSEDPATDIRRKDYCRCIKD